MSIGKLITALSLSAFISLSIALAGTNTGSVEFSQAAKSSAVLNSENMPIGLAGYENAGAALRAGDMAAYLEALENDADNEILSESLRSLILIVDALAADNLERAQTVMTATEQESADSQLTAYINSWISAFEGNADKAISEHRAAASGLPGYTSDLSLAALLEALGREEQALAVYAALTPGEIEAPEHQFDIKGLYFSHIRTVVARRALLLRRLGRVEAAKEVYRKLAEAEPEMAVAYAAAIDSIESGRGIDDEPLTPRTALARTLVDISGALSQQRIFQRVRARLPLNDFDETKSALDQAALLLVPEDEDQRNLVIDTLHSQAYYDGAAHVAFSAPEMTPSLALSAAQAYTLLHNRPDARTAIDMALNLKSDDAEQFNIHLRAAYLYALLDFDSQAITLSEKALEMTQNKAEEANAHAAYANILHHLSRYEDALIHARKAVSIDDTHNRRTYLTYIMGELGLNDEALLILRREQLQRPNDPYMLNTLGYYLLTKTNKHEEAYRLLHRAETLVSNNPHIRDSFGWARYHFGDLTGALKIITASRDLLAPQKHWEIEDHLGDIYWHLDRQDDAKDAWKDALKLYPPYRARDTIKAKLADGLATTPPPVKPFPSISLSDDGQLNERDI